ncbi:glucans biosynthesis protein [Siculibacillus lacustris]|uniref:Glucans biosynthesis protein G n=1 Tax=Siculibacillus lacustris TaxID=1549641 RepID=A0A4Q9VS68_9HYPH|nr:glucan biosynthesis protein [Siculibacillus lacustris]TBW38473.1 glucans biosynthesis protein [Siculibacillus lacustris]
MDRRDFLTSSLAAAAALGLGVAPAAAQDAPIPEVPARRPEPQEQPAAFSFAGLKDEARKMAAAAWNDPGADVPQRFRDLSFDQYRDIRWKRDRMIWRDDRVGFRLEPMAAGSVYNRAVRIYLVEGGQALPIGADRDSFDWGASIKAPEEVVAMPLSGLKLRRPGDNNRNPEFAVFQGASYFKALARGLQYGLTARGLAINTADPEGEIFPVFTRFYVEKPEENAQSIRLYGLLESRPVVGAYRFTLRPGDETSIDVELTLFPREEMSHIGLGALNTMFLYGGIGRSRFDDVRQAVHLSDGLAVQTGQGERLWRPTANPKNLQISAFGDENPLGFGLVQRARDFTDYLDLDNRWDLRPTAWVEPVGDWGKGSVVLVEIPSDGEIHENIVAYWRPKAKLPAGQEFSAAYRLRWLADGSLPASLGWVDDTREGQGAEGNWRRWMIDFVGPMPAPAQVKLVATASAGKLVAPTLKPNPVTGGYRVTFDLDPRNAPLSELRVQLTDGTKPVSETWLYRWVA